jgi:hypothetical protein
MFAMDGPINVKFITQYFDIVDYDVQKVLLCLHCHND